MIATGLLAASVLDKVALIEHVATGIEGGHLEGDSVRQVVQERVEVELLLTAAGDIEGDRLLASHTAQARCRIKGARAAGVVELHLADVSRNVVSDDEATERHDTVERCGKLLGSGIRYINHLCGCEGFSRTTCGVFRLSRTGERQLIVIVQHIAEHHHGVTAYRKCTKCLFFS